MSVLGVIAVYQCDGCGCVKTLHTGADLQVFSQWISGKTKDFCPACKFTNIAAEPQPNVDLATEKIVTALIRRIKNSSLGTPHSALEKEAA